MTEYTKTGQKIHRWEPEKNIVWHDYRTTLTDKDHERFLAAFGGINRAAFMRNLILKELERKETEKNEQAKES